MVSDRPKTGLVIPCFNEAQRLPAASVCAFLARCPFISICFVDDGSTDGTGRRISRIAEKFASQVSMLRLDRNLGKAEAVRQGMRHLCGMDGFVFLGYWDADAATPLDEVHRFIEVFETDPGVKLVMGARVRRLGARIQRTWYRHYLGRIFATLASVVLQMPVYDTQCGAKLFAADLARTVFEKPLLTRWIFDVELLARVSRVFPADVGGAVFELPLRVWEDKASSRLKFIHYLQAPLELYRVYVRYKAEG